MVRSPLMSLNVMLWRELALVKDETNSKAIRLSADINLATIVDLLLECTTDLFCYATRIGSDWVDLKFEH